MGMRRLNRTEYFFPMGCRCEPVLARRVLCSQGRRSCSEVNVNTRKASASHLMGVGQKLLEGKVVPVQLWQGGSSPYRS